MKTITIKAPDQFAQNLINMANELHISKSELIRQAVEKFRQQHEATLAKTQLQNASLKVRQYREHDDWDSTLMDGLEENES